MSDGSQADKSGKWWQGRATHSQPQAACDLPSPFVEYSYGDYGSQWGPSPKTLAELRMYELSWVLRSKSDWQRKASDAPILSKWRTEVLEQQKSLPQDQQLSEKMVDYVLAELTGYANIADNERGIERGCFDAIWYSDRLIPGDLAERLKSAAAALEDVPENEKDWHPGSHGQVLDLVHPSLYCIVYGRTHAYLPDEPRIQENLLLVPNPAPTDTDPDRDWAISKEFCWMPSDFAVLTDGSVKLVSPYINNLHPSKHRLLYRVIEEVLRGFIPMFERVLGEIDKERRYLALKERCRMDNLACIWPNGEQPYDPDLEDELGEAGWIEYCESLKKLPDASTYAGELEKVLSQVLTPISLRGRTLQCIIKLANIHLSPEQPKYAGGSWHVEGMMNENIVASGIYYYDEENITESRLAFRVPTEEPEYHCQDDSECMGILYGMDRDEDCVQEIGSMVTKAGRALSWPNLYQHRVSPFELADATKAGHRKILAIFLVDPTVNPIASATTDIPPQQADWTGADTLQELLSDPQSLISRLPQELADMIKDRLLPMTLTRDEAEAYRLQLMKERTAFVSTHTETTYHTLKFNMCEH
ncbi:hypothetical protein B0H15DRAFT_347160 [Mycena belliarum]|uniref:Uncharacterized protein n=1 Tax=Mycena belliarum TaxID=1033014 RepID=A0AAD6U2W9_9AGAR|nr:hypothetical protein B0H15DRAFT_347160 [Mycena belliae]